MREFECNFLELPVLLDIINNDREIRSASDDSEKEAIAGVSHIDALEGDRFS